MNGSFHSPHISPRVTGAFTAVGLLGAIYASVAGLATEMPASARAFMIAWLTLSVALSFLVTPKHFTVGFLCGLLSMLIGWRIAGLYGLRLVEYPLLAAFIVFLLQFFDCARADAQSQGSRVPGLGGWHLTFLRIYIGFDMVPHFTEKLFAGAGPYLEDVKGFAALGVPSPDFFVTLGGLCELGIAIGIGIGLLTRLAAVCATLYFLIATVLGGHFGNGFIWASPGGGWEYPVLMMVLFTSFAYAGAGRFSIDRSLLDAGFIPRGLRWLAVRDPGRASAQA